MSLMRASRGNSTGVLLLLAGMALFGSATRISKLVGEGLPVFTASSLRVVLGALSLCPFEFLVTLFVTARTQFRVIGAHPSGSAADKLFLNISYGEPERCDPVPSRH